ncbi:ComF family protein [Reinekea sp.]|uniref:ComF family protein n=1 Tax=Reinekea sp. TaxID=1970455 RepID=UPI002A7F1818|nr:ComF family protein [Reinekea sp.]
MLRSLIQSLRHALPLLCPGCLQAQRNGALCPVCESYLATIDYPCPSCGAPGSSFEVCGACLKKPPPWDSLHGAWHFEGLSRHLIHQFKYQHNIAAGRALVMLWLAHQTALFKPDAVVAVPMHYRKQQQKGFNQAEWLARQIGAHWSMPQWHGVRRIKATTALEGLDKGQRKQMLSDAFRLTDRPPRSVALVDDVLTSGATAAELTRLLKRNGTQFVSIWILARTPL